MFVGHQRTSVDDKNRMVLPAKMRQRVLEASPSRQVMLVPWVDQSLCVYMPVEWEAMAKKIYQNPYELPESRRVWRSVFPYAEEAYFDQQWRVLIPKTLLERAGIQRELVVTGMFDHLEIYSPEAWQKIEEQRTLEEDIQKTYQRQQPSQ